MIARSLLSAALALTTCGVAADGAEYLARNFAGPAGKTLPYRLLGPIEVEKGKRYPLVVLLHGYGERGTDNEKPIKAANSGASLFLLSDVRKKYPCFVAVPQAPDVWVAEPDFHVNTPFRTQPQDSILLVGLLIPALAREHPIDLDRVVLMGFSNGGCGVWDLLVRAPAMFAAAVVISGAGDPARAALGKQVPTWVFHGAKDKTVPVARAHDMIAALKKSGGRPQYTEYPGAAHGDTPLKAHKEAELLPWMFAQRRGKPAVSTKR
jgi:predicted peptidase